MSATTSNFQAGAVNQASRQLREAMDAAKANRKAINRATGGRVYGLRVTQMLLDSNVSERKQSLFRAVAEFNAIQDRIGGKRINSLKPGAVI